MFGHLIQKELRHYMLDFRFIAIFVLCALLSVLSVYVGGEKYRQQLREYVTVSQSNQNRLRTTLEKGYIYNLWWFGYNWNRRPEVLSPLVYGLSGKLGQEVNLHAQRPVEFEGSSFETDPVHALFGVLDLDFIVKIVLSLCVLLLTYDSICGEKEAGTLRLYASFSVSRSRLALAKLVGSTLAIIVPLLFAFLLASAVLVLSPRVSLQVQDWMRIVALMGVFVLYLMVFIAFGLWISASTHRRMTAFLSLLCLWTVWIFVVPDIALRIARRLSPVESIYDVEKRIDTIRWEIRTRKVEELRAYRERARVEYRDAITGAQQEKAESVLRAAYKTIREKWNLQYYRSMTDLQAVRHSQMQEQRALLAVLSSLSPLGAISFTSMDLARTGPIQQARIIEVMGPYLVYLDAFIQENLALPSEIRDLTDFSPFTYRDTDTLADCISRNAFHIVNLVLLALVGFAGAYMALMRYDVR